jgi:hypothetical protein
MLLWRPEGSGDIVQRLKANVAGLEAMLDKLL